MADTFEPVCIHDGSHHFAVDGEGYVDESALDQGRPVLVSHRMTQFDARAYRHFGRHAQQIVQMHNHHVAQLDARDDGRGSMSIPEQHVAITDIGAAANRDRQLGALCGRRAETALLRLPLIDLDQVHLGRSQPGGPFRIADVA